MGQTSRDDDGDHSGLGEGGRAPQPYRPASPRGDPADVGRKALSPRGSEAIASVGARSINKSWYSRWLA